MDKLEAKGSSGGRGGGSSGGRSSGSRAFSSGSRGSVRNPYRSTMYHYRSGQPYNNNGKSDYSMNSIFNLK